MLHPRDRYRKETSNTCLEIWVALIATVIVILLGVCLYLAIHQRSSVSDDTKKITSARKTIRLTDVISNNTITPIEISLKKAQPVHKENVTVSKVVIETSSNQKTDKLVPIKLIAVSHNSLARKGRYMRRALLKNKKSKYSNSD